MLFNKAIQWKGTGDDPGAYLNWLVFDKNFKFQDGGYVRMTNAAKEGGSDVPHEELSAEVIVSQ